MCFQHYQFNQFNSFYEFQRQVLYGADQHGNNRWKIAQPQVYQTY